MRSLWWKILYFFTALVFALFMAVNGYSRFLTVGVIVVAALLAFLLLYYYPLLLEKRIDRLESFLRKQKKLPAIYINFVLANKLDDEATLIIEQLMNKYKKAETQASFKAAFGGFRGLSQGYGYGSGSCAEYPTIRLPHVLRNALAYREWGKRSGAKNP